MNPFPDYSAAYIVLRTSSGAEGHGLVFTVGRGTEIVVAAVRTLASMVVGRPVEELLDDPGALARRLTGDSQIRWLGPEKGVMHMAAASSTPCGISPPGGPASRCGSCWPTSPRSS
jgi:L-fuconate dehydratase